MNIKQILSSDLPQISESIKIMINRGMWYLYEVNDPKYSYMLKTTGTTYLLDESGKFITMFTIQPKDIKIDSLIYFKDKPFPPLVNSFMSI